MSISEEIRAWLLSKGFVEDGERLCFAWSCRSGYDYTDLEFQPWHNDKYPNRWDAIVGHHASGTNPRMIIGVCESLADVRMVYEAIRLTNGYQAPEQPGSAK